ncbi:MAG: gamma-glutamyltransferase [Methylacidiphilales bacterium]|nr:gamma-glutamyltransferase [Candidatus Methylacidiphilales bacterium]
MSTFNSVIKNHLKIVVLLGSALWFNQCFAEAHKKFSSMVVAAHPLASQAGMNILDRGGSAVDAAIAVQAMLTLVEPQSSGIGGGGFMLYWDAKTKKLYSYDGRETAPASVDEKLFIQSEKPLDWSKAAQGGIAVGVPGVLAMLHLAHTNFGRLAWRDLFTQSIEQANKGFAISPQLSSAIAEEALFGGLGTNKDALKYFFDSKRRALLPGHLLKNPALAQTFSLLASKGVSEFYCGSIADKIVSSVQKAKQFPGSLKREDLCNYRATIRTPVCSNYHQYHICGMGPPSSGGTTVSMILSMLEKFNLKSFEPNTFQFVHLFTQASRLAYADRNAHLADPDFVSAPLATLLSPAYLSSRSKLILTEKDMGTATTGIPRETVPDRSNPSTSHFVIVDKQGNIVSMTSSVEKGFGSTLMAGGFILNNQLTDFSFETTNSQGESIANRVQPGKRPRSSMSPTIIFDSNMQPRYALGSPGGPRIIEYVAKTIIALLDWQLDAKLAPALPHITNMNTVTELEENTPVATYRQALEQMGHTVVINKQYSGIHVIAISDSGLVGGADPRREGLVIGK